MADKEVGDGSVKQLAPELDAESVAVVEKKEEGESLLLPLIQGILQNPKYQNLSARQLLSLNLSKTIAQTGATSSKMNNELNATDQLGNDCLPIEDSGTESGEDLRLLAAGLQSNLSGMEVNNESNDIEAQSPQNKGKNDALAAGLLLEVTTALARLQNSINQGEIELEESKKTALLSLVNRLQQGLVSPEKIPENIETESPVAPASESPQEGNSERRGSAGINRFAKRRNRTNRHTVGVTREELADARRIIEELEFIGIQNSNQNLENLVHKPKAPTTVIKPFVPFSRQISEPVTLLRPSQFVPKDTIKQIEIPNRNFKSKVLFKQSISLDQPISILKNNQETSPKIEDKPTIFKKFTIQRNSSGSNNKFPVNNHKDEAPTDESSSSDDDDEMVNTKFYNNNTASKFKAKENYLRNQQPVERSLNYSSGDETSTPGTRQPKYVSKKMKMKRANTVDLPKSYSFVNTFDLSDKDCSDSESRRSVYQSRPSNAGLRTTITGGSPSNLPPQFTPKTENDKKFLAFIQKQNSSVTPSYVNPCDKNSTKTHNWTNKFGHLKNRFEGDEPQMPSKPPAKASNQAATFWKGIEKEKPSAKVSPLPPVQPFMKELPLVSEKFPWKSNLTEKIFKTDEQIVLKKKPMIEKFVPKEIKAAPEPPRVFSEPNKLPILKPSNVNNFSHAPMSAFKPPISRKLSNSFKPIHTTEEIIKKPLPQVSNGIVKQMAETSYNGHSNNQVPQPRKIILSSPTRSIGDSTMVKITKYSEKPEAKQPVAWAGKQKSERVLSLAASKFENVPTVNMAVNLHNLPPVDPPVKYRTNPLYNGTFEKRSSLPPNASYATFDSSLYSKQGQSVSNVNAVPKEATFTITDFTQPISVSTYALPEQTSKRPTYDRQESLTNPELEPLVLTATRTVFSPNDKPKPMELYDIPTPNSSQFSKDHSIGSMCDDIENEIADIGVECNVAVSKVMKGPVAQMAYTQCSELTSLNGQEKENSMIKNLSDSLKKLSQKSPTPEKRQVDVKRLSHDSSNSSLDFKVSSPFKISSNSEVHLSKDSSNSSIDSSKLPPLKIPIPAVPETSYSITYSSPPKIQVKSPSVDPPHHVLYNKIAPNVQSTPHHNQGLQRARSSHMLEIPRPTDPAVPPQAMYGASQSMVAAKQKTVQSYFGPKRAESLSMKSATSYVRPVTFNSPTQPSTIARKISLYSKPVQKVAHQAPLYSLARSRTLPSMANVDLLDESNIDDAFEELLSSTNL